MTEEIKYPKFIEYVHEQFSEKISKEELEQLLALEEDYNRDNPASLGRSLTLIRLRFKGKKLTGEEFLFDQQLHKGINVWIADNGKGKSTMFKCIKYALTGKNSIKTDIRDWFEEILLEFEIGGQTYTVLIDKTGNVSQGGMYNSNMREFLASRENGKLDTLKPHFVFRGDPTLEGELQKFFFNQFAFYSLQYTKSSGRVDNLQRQVASLSWATYFKSVYLESSDHKYLFLKESYGQDKKIFDMLLGLRLTYPINRLTLMMNKEDEEIARLKLYNEVNEKNMVANRKQLEQRLEKVEKALEVIEKNSKLNFDTTQLLKEQIVLQALINEGRKKIREANFRYHSQEVKYKQFVNELAGYEADLASMETEAKKLDKQLLNLSIYREAGSFFTNLEIKSCPHCEETIPTERREKEVTDHACMLCGTHATTPKADVEELDIKLQKVSTEKTGYADKIKALAKKVEELKKQEAEDRKKLTTLYNEITAIPSVDKEEKRLREIESQVEKINSKRKEALELFEKKDDLKNQRAVLKYRLEEIEKGKPEEETKDPSEKHQLRKEIYQYAVASLRKRSNQLNEHILRKLEGLILQEINSFGLRNITKVEINEDHDLKFTQNQKVMSFEELNEGEKLRAKLAFYLSLIQLDIEHHLGRHCRFLIFDAPGGEEMIKEDLNGLSAILKEVNNRFAENLQIFVGTALPEFKDAADPEKVTVKAKEEYMF